MADDEDDYLSDKFLLEIAPVATKPKPATYVERRKQAQREAEIKNVQNRKKSRRQIEEEAREEGLKKSLFEKAKEEEQELGIQSKAMSLMLKMGFKPGQSLGQSDNTGDNQPGPSSERVKASVTVEKSGGGTISGTDLKDSGVQHRKEPLPLDFWTGKKGLGSGKRALSPGATERNAKVAKLDEEANKETYRSRAREDYEERRAEGRLLSATRTLQELDEKGGVQFNVLSLNPHDVDSIPPELLEKLTDYANEHSRMYVTGDKEAEHEKLRRQMRRDALQPLDVVANDEDSPDPTLRKQTLGDTPLSEAIVEDAAEHLQQNARERLQRVLTYLRQKYFYCFWCGTRYDSQQDLDANCPGEEEDAH